MLSLGPRDHYIHIPISPRGRRGKGAVAAVFRNGESDDKEKTLGRGAPSTTKNEVGAPRAKRSMRRRCCEAAVAAVEKHDL